MKPILFNTEMVRAILEGRKTATRRVIKPQPICYGPNVTFKPHSNDFFLSAEKSWLRCRVCGHDPEYSRDGSNTSHHWIPPYRPGDILYVQETWDFKPNNDLGYIYRADYSGLYKIKWRPSIHMPRDAARIFLRVTDVRVERLQGITDDDAMQEGIQYTDFGTYLPNWKISIDSGKTFHSAKSEIHNPSYHVGKVTGSDQCYPTARGAYHALWDSPINPTDREKYGWGANPWVWVIEFDRISKEACRRMTQNENRPN